MTIKGVAFDQDGLIFDTEGIWAEVHTIVFSRYEIPFTEDDHKKHYTETSSGTEGILMHYGMSHLLEQVRREMFALRKAYTSGIKFMEGARELIDLLYPHLPLGIVTYAPRESTEHTLDYFNIRDRFKFLVTRHDTENQKPHPEPYLKAAELAGLPASEMMAFEDTSKGIISAKDAGMKCIAVPNKWTEHGDFSRADRVVKSLNDVNMEMIFSL